MAKIYSNVYLLSEGAGVTMDYEKIGLVAKNDECKRLMNKIVKPKSATKTTEEAPAAAQSGLRFDDLTGDCIEKIACFLDFRLLLGSCL